MSNKKAAKKAAKDASTQEALEQELPRQEAPRQVVKRPASAWVTPLLIVAVGLSAYGVGWWSGKNGSYVRGLIEAARMAAGLKARLDLSDRVLTRYREDAVELARKKLALEQKLHQLTRKKKRAVKRSDPEPKPWHRHR